MTPDYQTSLSTHDAAKLLGRLAAKIEANAYDAAYRDAALAVATSIASGTGGTVNLFLTEAEKKACIAAERDFKAV